MSKDAVEVELQMVISSLKWVLGTELSEDGACS